MELRDANGFYRITTRVVLHLRDCRGKPREADADYDALLIKTWHSTTGKRSVRANVFAAKPP